ncbi:MAG: ADP compounds hydrolase NudE [Xanthomonadales bacterium]|nr:ADP compounds hydrolase NudE [Xanthomonadales bacterium]
MERPLPVVHATRELDARGRLVLEELELEFANGVRRRFERLRGTGRGAVVIVPLLDRDTVLLVREYAAGLHRYELGLPKGRIEPGESPEQAADRELKEEIGFGARRIVRLARLSLAPAYMSHVSQVVLAEELYEERLPGDEPEELEVVPWSLSRLHELLDREDCTEGRSLAALFIAREWLARR